MYSSTELSTISQMRWWSPLPSTPPMYIDGRLRTGSRPSRTEKSFQDRSRVTVLMYVTRFPDESNLPLSLALLFVPFGKNAAGSGIDHIMRTTTIEVRVFQLVI